MQRSISSKQEIPKTGVWYYRNSLKPGTSNYPEADELKYSIRSAVKNVDIEKVILLGDKKPSWFMPSDKAIFVSSPYIPDPNSPIASVPWNHLKRLMESNVYSGEFLLFNDDFFVIDKLDKWCDVHRDENDYFLKVSKNVEYDRREKRAYASLNLPNMKHYNLHIPMRVDTHNLHDAFSFRLRSIYSDLPFKTIYGNMFLKDISVPYADVKNSPDGVFFSSSEQTWYKHEWLREKFQEPSFCELS